MPAPLALKRQPTLGPFFDYEHLQSGTSYRSKSSVTVLGESADGRYRATNQGISVLSRWTALTLLDQCTGRDIWPVDLCAQQGVPQAWIDELADAFESGFGRDRDTIYRDNQALNQFHGVRDVDLARKLGTCLGIDVARVTAMAVSREAIVAAIKEAIEED